ncbi:MAG: PEP-CTERM sorting domain-containing protein [Armatimonadetes bacterium]|nr:PEP-CTERM sorting domain-containing protein [Armatimonadota bacterium]
MSYSRLIGLVVVSALGTVAYSQNYAFQEISSFAMYTDNTLADSGQYLVNQYGNWYVSTRDGNMTALQSFNGNTIYASAINSSGLVGGSTKIGFNSYGDLTAATLWTNGVATQLNPWGESSLIRSIANDGTVFGISSHFVGNTVYGRCWSYKNGAYTFLNAGTIPFEQIGIWAGNSHGLTVGGTDNPEKATMWQGTTKTVIGGLGGYQYSQATDVNESGQILVSSFPDYGTSKGRSDIYDHGTWISPGQYNGNNFKSSGINDAGLLIGASYDSQGAKQANVLWSQSTGFIDMTNVEPLAGFHIYQISNLNNLGEFMVEASHWTGSSWDNRIFIATPSSVPEPASILALSLGGILLLRSRKRA